MRFDTLPDGDGWLAIEGGQCICDGDSPPRPDCAGILPDEVLDLLAPCDTCNGHGTLAEATGPLSDPYDCPDCVDDRRKFDVETPCGHCDPEDSEWWCGCGDSMDDEQHANYGACETCRMFYADEPCTGTITRTFTVGEYGLVEVVHNDITPSLDNWNGVEIFDDHDPVLWLDAKPHDIVTVHGANERTTHGLHVVAVGP